MNRVIGDLRYGLRILGKNRGFTAVPVLTLAIGIGANRAIFSLVDTVLLRPLPYRQPDRLVLVSESLPKMGMEEVGVSLGEYQDYRRQNRSFSEMAAYETQGFNLTGANQPVRVNAARISASAFLLLGTSPELGRAFTEDEDRHGAGKVARLSHANHVAGVVLAAYGCAFGRLLAGPPCDQSRSQGSSALRVR